MDVYNSTGNIVSMAREARAEGSARTDTTALAPAIGPAPDISAILASGRDEASSDSVVDRYEKLERLEDAANDKVAAARFLRQLMIAADTRREIDEQIATFGQLARDSGATWQQIGVALDISPQAARQRFDPEAKRRHAERQRNRVSGTKTPPDANDN